MKNNKMFLWDCELSNQFDKYRWVAFLNFCCLDTCQSQLNYALLDYFIFYKTDENCSSTNRRHKSFIKKFINYFSSVQEKFH